jgi:hypothetical protein
VDLHRLLAARATSMTSERVVFPFGLVAARFADGLDERRAAA